MNYLLEGGGDFHSELLEAICKDNTNKSSNLCLITAMPLEQNYITLYNNIFAYISSYACS